MFAHGPNPRSVTVMRYFSYFCAPHLAPTFDEENDGHESEMTCSAFLHCTHVMTGDGSPGEDAVCMQPSPLLLNWKREVLLETVKFQTMT